MNSTKKIKKSASLRVKSASAKSLSSSSMNLNKHLRVKSASVPHLTLNHHFDLLYIRFK